MLVKLFNNLNHTLLHLKVLGKWRKKSSTVKLHCNLEIAIALKKSVKSYIICIVKCNLRKISSYICCPGNKKVKTSKKTSNYREDLNYSNVDKLLLLGSLSSSSVPPL